MVANVDPKSGESFEEVELLTMRKEPTKITIQMSGFSIEAELHRDGDQFCILLGQDLQSGFAVFGHSVFEAVLVFKHAITENQIPVGAKI